MNRIDLAGCVAVVTGGAKGIGLAIARRFLASGAEVVVWDQDGPAIAHFVEQTSDQGLNGAVVDVSDLDAVEAARDTVIAERGRIDILVNNAGISGPTRPVERYDPLEWRRVIDVNLNGVFNCCRAVVAQMRGQQFGRIINMASLAGKEGTPNAAAYSASKAGVIAFTKSLGKELAQSGILVNCMAPAAVDTQLLEQMTQEHVAVMLSKSPMGRFGTVEEVAAMVAWLASKECSFNTGAVFDLSGGRATY